MKPAAWLRDRGEGAELSVRVSPRAAKESIEEKDGLLRVRVTAPASDDRANVAVIKALAKKLGVSKSSVTIIRGQKAREKTVLIAGASAERVQSALES